MDSSGDKLTKATLAATSWALLGMMSYEEEVSGYDLEEVDRLERRPLLLEPVVQPDLHRAEET